MEPSKKRISNAQREVLENAYQHGLVTTSEKFLAEFKELESETGLDIPTIKVWINNRRRREKRKHADSSREAHDQASLSIQKKMKTAKLLRQVSGHNLFCSSLWSGGKVFLDFNDVRRTVDVRILCRIQRKIQERL